jgi:enamine deaminase RidA (YjgF/YER057c/UK114 family)
VAGGFVFCSGTAGIDPATDVPGDGVEEQTELALRNLDAILTTAGTSLSALVKTTIFYTSVEDFTTINAVYALHARPAASSLRACQRGAAQRPAYLDRCCRRASARIRTV